MTPDGAVLEKIDKALGEFELINGSGSEDEKKACAMTLLAWVCGEPWTDHPPCAHRVIANNVIAANDAGSTTPAMRRELVKAGADGVLDTWWMPGEVLASALALHDGDEAKIYDRTMRLLERVAAWKNGSKERPDLREAVLRGAVLREADLRGADLSKAVLREAVLREADLRGADLSKAVLSGADLSEADLRGADLREAVLSGADLSGAVGTPLSPMPKGWKIEYGIWTPDYAKAAA